jgi:hypothetical protein
MLSSPFKYNSEFIEATVLSVDPIKFVCSVKTINGKMFQNISWLLPTGGATETGMHITPSVQDRVLVSTSLGYPLILGCIPRVGTYNGETASITGADPTIDLGSDSTIRGSSTANPSKPNDMVPGDFAYTVRGGGLVAVLSSGIAILKASTMSQIVLCKFEGLVRLITRNYQRFSDSSSRVACNMKGRLYEFFGVDWNVLNNQIGQERYNELYGDVAAGEVLRGAPSPTAILPSVDTRVRKVWLTDASNHVLMVETLNQDGSMTLVVENAVASATSTTTINNGEWQQKIIGGGNSSTITITPTSIVVDYNEVSTGTFNASSVVIAHGGSTGTFDATQSSLDSNGHFCRVTSTGVAMG